MKRSDQFVLYDVAGKHVLVPIGTAASEFDGVVELNGMGATVWGLLERDIAQDRLIAAIVEEYEVCPDRARADIGAFLDVLRDAGCIEE